MTSVPGIVGRFVSFRFQRGETVVVEPCEVMACEASQYAWRLLIATHDGTLLTVDTMSDVSLVATPSEEPYR